ncbi:cbb3-type cytochrome c oxidase subunit 3 [Roseicyclus sp.]|uniref:cbb3-type cytochrome c oxidase subunit 3 n=1 Tax=Roseicyclus sp. TaxID=1914329 RepID=UPI001BCE7CC9|nr:cbb3-type cytochrome c oxidase subunit 3 [Roseicyclus sp.]
MEDTYTILQIIARSWGALFMLVVFLGVIVFTLRPGSRRLHSDIANIPFRHDDRPAPEDAAQAKTRQFKEARQ